MEVLLSNGGFTWDGERPPKQRKLPSVVCLYPRPAVGGGQLLDMALLEYPLLPAAAGQQITSWREGWHKKRKWRKVEAASCEDPEVMQSTKLTAQLLSFKSLIRAKIICR